MPADALIGDGAAWQSLESTHIRSIIFFFVPAKNTYSSRRMAARGFTGRDQRDDQYVPLIEPSEFVRPDRKLVRLPLGRCVAEDYGLGIHPDPVRRLWRSRPVIC